LLLPYWAPFVNFVVKKVFLRLLRLLEWDASGEIWGRKLSRYFGSDEALGRNGDTLKPSSWTIPAKDGKAPDFAVTRIVTFSQTTGGIPRKGTNRAHTLAEKP
jgi:hypothetical protein